jgi:outer membrane protein assembly factor BamB
VYSYHIPTATKNWRKEFLKGNRVGRFNYTGLLLEGDRVFANPDDFDVICLNAETGSTIWRQPDFGPVCSPHMRYHNGMLITTSFGQASVLFFDANSGILLHKEKSKQVYFTDVAYDKTHDMFFTNDIFNVIGFKINR